MQHGGNKYYLLRRLLQTSICLMGVAPVYAGNICSEPAWQDNFEEPSLNNDKWHFAIGDGCDQNLCGWGNNEKQWYSPDNIELKQGLLVISAKQEIKKQPSITSGKLTTKGLFSQKYGRFEAKMKLPKTLGLWPAFWMMPESANKPWPIEGEIDILEQGGRDKKDFRRILGAIHFGKPWPKNIDYSESLLSPRFWGDDFHTYRVDWLPNRIRWSVDNKVYGEVTPEDIHPHEWPFNNKPFYLILNLAVGGTLGGKLNKNFERAELQVDFVKVYELCDYEN